MKSKLKNDSKQAGLGAFFKSAKVTDLNLRACQRKTHQKFHNKLICLDLCEHFYFNACIKWYTAIKLEHWPQKTIRIQNSLGKIVIDNNQKVTEVIFYYQLSKMHQSEAKTLKFYKPCELFDIILLLRRNRRKLHKALGVAGNLISSISLHIFCHEYN